MVIEETLRKIQHLLKRTDHTRGRHVSYSTKVCVVVRYKDSLNYLEMEFDSMTLEWKRVLLGKQLGETATTAEGETIKIAAIFDMWQHEDVLHTAVAA